MLSIKFLFSLVILVRLLTICELLENVTKAKLSVSFINFTKYFRESFTNSIGSPDILPETSTIHIKSTGLTFSLLSSVDNETTKGV